MNHIHDKASEKASTGGCNAKLTEGELTRGGGRRGPVDKVLELTVGHKESSCFRHGAEYGNWETLDG